MRVKIEVKGAILAAIRINVRASAEYMLNRLKIVASDILEQRRRR